MSWSENTKNFASKKSKIPVWFFLFVPNLISTQFFACCSKLFTFQGTQKKAILAVTKVVPLWWPDWENRELVNKLKRKRTDDQGKGDSVHHQRVRGSIASGFSLR